MRPRAALAALVVASVALDLVFFTGFLASDDVLYLTAARELTQAGRLWPDPAPHEARLLMIGWCALAGLGLRHDAQAVAASFVAFHQALTALTFLLARPLLGAGRALVAAALSATFPLLVVFSTTILPDIPMTACLAGAFLAMRAALPHPPGPRRAGLMALAGLAVGVSYLAKESGLVAVPFFLALAVWPGESRREAGRGAAAFTGAACFAFGLVAVLVLETLALRALTGSWVFRLGAFFAGPATSLPPLDALGRRAALLRTAAGAHLPAVAALAAFAAAAAAYARHRPGLWPILLFPAWYASYYAWGSARLTSYYAPSFQARYFTPCVPFVIVAVSVCLGDVYDRVAAALGRRFQPPPERALRLASAGALSAAVLSCLAICDRHAGNVYGAPLARQTLRALRSEPPSTDAPIVLSRALGAQLSPLFPRRPPGLYFSHEVDAAQLDRWRGRGGFGFLDLHPASALRRPELNPLLEWPHGLPGFAGCADDLVESLRAGGSAASGWKLRPAGRFDRMGPRSAEIRAMLGDPAALARLRPRPDRGVLLYRVAAEDDEDVRYPLPAFDARETPSVVNGSFDRWSGPAPFGWQPRDSQPSPVPGPDGAAAVRIGPGAFSYLWQSMTAPRSLRGRILVLEADVRSDEAGAAQLWVKAAVGAEWDETLGSPHPGDGTWRPLQAELLVSPRFRGGELRVAVVHAHAGGRSEFANVRVRVR
jgi:hypothetical protein